MEKRKDTLSALKICRFCLTQGDSLTTLYDRTQKPKIAVPLSLKIFSCLSIETFPSDRMPSYICKRCSFFMDLFYEYKELCRSADERIFQYIQNGSAIKTLNWPNSLANIYDQSQELRGKAKTPHVVKAVVEGGTTVQVTSQEISNSEDEDDENVYNIKIGDGSGNEQKCIQLLDISQNNIEEEEQVTAMKPNKKGYYEYQDGDRLSRKNVKNVEDGCWACDECDCTYPLQQLLELHKKQKHRERTVQCDQCDSKFFSKYDLMTHSSRHSDEMPFQCVACDRKFKRLVLLKRHEKLIHSDIPQLPCPNCPATFLSIEELEAHQRRHVRHSERSHECPICDKKFHEKATLQRHMYIVHEREPTFRCEYCPEQFTSISKLARHVRSHAGERPYPCKYCDKSFLKSHHYTRHLRLKHRKTIRTSRGPFGQLESYPCEQCAETFTTQDDLIYHSAIHATQNLICPLCQEKFENVDAVTAHIKSHVNGIEFMCDLCELVFTTKEKLDSHLMAAHADELGDDLSDDESSEEQEGGEFEDDNGINVKEEDGEMVVEIKKSADYMLPVSQTEIDGKPDNMNSEESEAEITFAELATVDTLAIVRKEPQFKREIEKPQEVEPHKEVQIAATITKVLAKSAATIDQTASILRKAEEVKRKVQQNAVETTVVPEKKKVVPKVDSSNSVGGASDKSLRLLEKELQELKRTNTRNEATKPPAKSLESLRNRRPQLYTSTPKARGVEEKKAMAYNKSPALERKAVERRLVTKENKEPKETKAAVSVKEEREKETKEKETKDKEVKEKEVKEIKDKEVKEKDVKEKEVKEKDIKEKEVKEKDVKEKETPKSVVKNGTSDKTQPEETVRRSTRPSKIKDYAKMIRDKSQDSSDDDSDDVDDEEYKEIEKVEAPPRSKPRRGSVKTPAKPPPAPPAPAAPAPAPATRKRGRPRKEPKEVPAKMKKEGNEEESIEGESKTQKDEPEETSSQNKGTAIATEKPSSAPPPLEAAEVRETTPEDANKSPNAEQKASPRGGVIMSPSGQTLKKVPIRALPPGIKPMPLSINARPMGPGELCEMQIGKKVVKVQKIVMTKAEVEAMAKKGLVEMKDGTMVLKQGIRIPTSEALKSTLVGDKDAAKESPSKVEKPAVAQSKVNESS